MTRVANPAPGAPRRRGCWLQVRMHPHERAQLQALAARMGMGASELVRRLVAGAVAKMGLADTLPPR